jgi:hypothetical protein
MGVGVAGTFCQGNYPAAIIHSLREVADRFEKPFHPRNRRNLWIILSV